MDRKEIVVNRFRLNVFAVCLGLCGVASAQNFVNGGFDGSATGWSVLDCDFGGYQGSTGQNGNPGWVWLNNVGNASIPRVEQSVSGFTIGDSYTLKAWYGSGQIFNTNDVFEALIDGAVVFSGPNAPVVGWTEMSHTFTATAATHTFTFRAEVVADSDYVFDSASLIHNPVPEPGTMAALAVGSLALYRRRRQA
jgi:hypothetical protein